MRAGICAYNPTYPMPLHICKKVKLRISQSSNSSTDLRFKNPITRFKNSITRSCCGGGTAHHPQQPALQEFNHSLQEFSHPLLFRRRCSAPSTKTCASRIQSLASRIQSLASRIQSLASRIQSLALVSTVVQWTILKNLRFVDSRVEGNASYHTRRV